ncbi:MAG: PGF-pre-PGF domain-containing protein, partial [Candidatus Aenigmarchaeota archaeon]|nr:PGF-pre-PGF domain-containing protein [Candidatus Aenigmarchaeota archaeon]
TTNNRTFNTSVFDGLTLVDTVYFWFDNGTGKDFNITGTNRSGQWSVSYNVSALVEERQGVRIIANDTVNNVNNTFVINFTVDFTVPNVTINYNFADNSNFSIRSNNQTFNASVFDNLTLVDTVYFWFDNGTGADVNITGTNRSGQWSVSYNVSALAEGKQGVRIVANDTVNNVNSSYFINFTVDLTSPNVTINLGTANNPTIQYGSNFTATTNNRTFNTSVFDGLTLVDTVYFWFDNATGNDFNVTGINNSGQWSVSYNVSSLYGGNGDITQTVRVMANDTLNNLNNSVFWNFTVDRTNPVVTASSSGVTSTAATLTATINESVNNCTYSVTNGAGSGTMTKSSSTSFTATLVLLPSTDYVATLNCYDFVNNNGLSTTSFTSSAAAAASTGGSGSGGSSGGISTSVQGSFEKKVWTSINAGETASVALKNGVMGVTEVSFSVPATVYGAWVNVAKKDSLPSSVSSFSGKVYRNLEISKGPALNKEGAYTDATVKFKVEKAWLAEKQLTKEAVALHHYDGSKWVELSTSVGEDDGTYVHYSAKTPSFSYFVIGEKSGAQAAPAVEQPVVEAPTEQPVVEAPAEAPAVAEKKGMSTGLLVALLAVAVVVVAAVVYMRKRR